MAKTDLSDRPIHELLAMAGFGSRKIEGDWRGRQVFCGDTGDVIGTLDASEAAELALTTLAKTQ